MVQVVLIVSSVPAGRPVGIPDDEVVPLYLILGKTTDIFNAIVDITELLLDRFNEIIGFRSVLEQRHTMHEIAFRDFESSKVLSAIIDCLEDASRLAP